MSYSCSDFVETILDALEIKVPEESLDSPSDQADLALEAIMRLQRIEKETGHALLKFTETRSAEELISRLKVVLAQ